jgi:hypothetical protein
MALAQCRECGKDVSSEAPTCPHCGVSQPARSASPPPPRENLAASGRSPFQKPAPKPSAPQSRPQRPDTRPAKPTPCAVQDTLSEKDAAVSVDSEASGTRIQEGPQRTEPNQGFVPPTPATAPTRDDARLSKCAVNAPSPPHDHAGIAQFRAAPRPRDSIARPEVTPGCSDRDFRYANPEPRM